MRITRSIMVNNMLHWTEQQMDKLNDISNIVASGKQINKPSDDPTATGQILSDRVTLSSCGQYDSNISQAKTWIETSSTTLEAVDSYLTTAQEIMSDLTPADPEDPEYTHLQNTNKTYLETMENIYGQVLALANSKYGSSYMYSGNVSDTAPFSNVSVTTDPDAEDIVFDLAADSSPVTIEISDSLGNVVRTLMIEDAKEGINTLSWDGHDEYGNDLPDGNYEFAVTNDVGDDVTPSDNSVSVTNVVLNAEDIVFDLAADSSLVTIEISDSLGNVVRTLTMADIKEGTNTLSWDGLDKKGHVLLDDAYEFTVKATDSEGNSVAACPSYRGNEGGKTVITGEGGSITINNNGEKIFGKALSTLSQAISAIKNAINDPDYEIDLGDDFDEAIAAVQAESVSLANINAQLEYRNDRLEQITTIANNRISDTEVGSSEEAAIKLQTQQTSYDVTLEAVASVLKMTKLSDLL